MVAIVIIGLCGAVLGLTAISVVSYNPPKDIPLWLAYICAGTLMAGTETTRASLVFLNAKARQNRPGEYWAIFISAIVIAGILQWGIHKHVKDILYYTATAANWLILAAEFSLSSVLMDQDEIFEKYTMRGKEIRDLESKLKEAEESMETERIRQEKSILELERLKEELQPLKEIQDTLKGASKIAINGKTAKVCQNGHLTVSRGNGHVPKECSCGASFIHDNPESINSVNK